MGRIYTSLVRINITKNVNVLLKVENTVNSACPHQRVKKEIWKNPSKELKCYTELSWNQKTFNPFKANVSFLYLLKTYLLFD